MKVIETQHVKSPDGRDLTIQVLESRSRPGTGRRIVVQEAGQQIYDTDDCYDLANAVNRLDHWCAKEMAKSKA